MNIIDSSGWLEHFSDGPNADIFSEPISDTSNLIVPVITVYEVFKVALRETDEQTALHVSAAMHKGKIIDVNSTLSMEAARLSLNHSLPMADSLIYATAITFQCTLWTQDIDFKNLPGVRYIPKL